MTGTSQDARSRPWVAALLVALAAASVYAGATRNGFVSLDDSEYVYENAHVTAGLTAEGVRWAFSVQDGRTYFHPLTWLSLMTDAQLFGPGPAAFHLVNVLLHALNAALLFGLLWTTTRRTAPAAVAALLWAVHPLGVEAVAWVTERKAVLSTAFLLGAALAHVAHARRPSAWRAAATTALLACAMLAKAASVVAPALLLVLDVWPLRRLAAGDGRLRAWLPLVREKLPGFAASLAVYGAVALSARGGLSKAAAVVPLGDRIANGLGAIPSYLSAFAWPSRLGVLHPYPDTVDWPRVAAGALVVVAASAAVVRLRRRWPAGLAGWAWFLVAVAPYLGVQQSGLWPEWAERFAYVPTMGLSVAVVFGGWDAVAGRPWARWCAVGAAAVLAALGATTAKQIEVWRDSYTLYSHAITVSPRAAILHSNLGKALLQLGRAADAKASFERAVACDPTFPWANAELASIAVREGRDREASRYFAAALRSSPDMPELLFNHAEFLRRTGSAADARASYLRFLDATRYRPGGARPYPNTAESLEALGRTAEAEAVFRRELELDPADPIARAQLGTLLMRAGRYAEARRELGLALQLRPDLLELLFNYAETLRASGDLEAARPYYARFVREAPPRLEAERQAALVRLAGRP